MSPPEELASRVAALPRPLLIALDVDGTLAPIVPDPASARVPDEVVAALRKIAAVPGVAVAIVTGRDAAQLARMVELESAFRAVEHGRAVLAPGEDESGEIDAAARARLERFRAIAAARFVPRGARIEEKRGAIVVHVRELAERDEDESRAILREAARAAADAGLFAREGRQVLEAQLAPADKGAALLEIARRTGAASVVYAGDDRTDEPAIALASARGIGVFVRSSERPDPPEGASAVVDGTGEVAAFLAALAARLRT
ncbi:MAG TPA: trehalose-phosphatase [Sandaracinaceae bacterium]